MANKKISDEIQYGHSLIALSNLSGLAVKEVVEIVQWIPWNVETIFRFYSIWGKFPTRH